MQDSQFESLGFQGLTLLKSLKKLSLGWHPEALMLSLVPIACSQRMLFFAILDW